MWTVAATGHTPSQGAISQWAQATGWAAMRFGWSAYVIPVLFAFSPTLIMIGQPADIVCAVDDWVEYTRSPAYLSKTPEASLSSTRGLWDDLSGQLFDFLEDVTLASLVQRAEIRDAAAATGHPGARFPAIAGQAA